MRTMFLIIISAVILLALGAQADTWIVTKGKIRKEFHNKVEAAKYVLLCMQDANLAVDKTKPKVKKGKNYAGL